MSYIPQRRSLADIHRESIQQSMGCLGVNLHDKTSCVYCSGALVNEHRPLQAEEGAKLRNVKTVTAGSELELKGKHPGVWGVYRVKPGLWSGIINVK